MIKDGYLTLAERDEAYSKEILIIHQNAIKELNAGLEAIWAKVKRSEFTPMFKTEFRFSLFQLTRDWVQKYRKQFPVLDRLDIELIPTFGQGSIQITYSRDLDLFKARRFP